ncbi:hypothetical protein ACI2JA_03840 [Alkalihalobacillus sp. NPDC078783]
MNFDVFNLKVGMSVVINGKKGTINGNERSRSKIIFNPHMSYTEEPIHYQDVRSVKILKYETEML